MGATKVGVSQFGRPSPLWWRRLQNALIIFLIPGAIGLVTGWGLSDKVANHWLMALGFAPALIKGIGTLMGDDQDYSPSNKAVDNAEPVEPEKVDPAH